MCHVINSMPQYVRCSHRDRKVHRLCEQRDVNLSSLQGLVSLIEPRPKDIVGHSPSLPQILQQFGGISVGASHEGIEPTAVYLLREPRK